MSFLIWHGGSVGLASDRRVLRPDEVQPLESALAVARRLADEQAAQAGRVQAAVAAGQAEGRHQGAAAAQAAAQVRLAEELTQLARQAQAHRERDQQAVARLALEVVRKLLGSLPQADRLAELAVQSARELLPARTWRLSVHPAQIPAVQARLLQLDPLDRTGLAQAELCADPGLPEDHCRLETDLGSAQASVEEQLQRLARAWAVADLPPGRP